MTRILAAIGIGAALLFFFVGLGADLPWPRLATKPVPALALAAWVALGGRTSTARLAAAGLVLSALGDLLLERGLFRPGLLAFLAAHVAYVAAFVSSERRPALGRALPFLAWGLGAFLLLRTGLGEMTAPVAVYVAVLCTMMWRAAARLGSPATPRAAALLGLAGAVAFGASDTLIAFDRFASPVPGARWTIMVLYWLGQWGIAASVVLRAAPTTSPPERVPTH
jgi:alkenylglycerophosphocholine/alkenylglycerophosphoethanolamine hydrolase